MARPREEIQAEDVIRATARREAIEILAGWFGFASSLRAERRREIVSLDASETAGRSEDLPHREDDPNCGLPADRSRINVNEDYEIRYWTKELGVSADELKSLVRSHGVSADKIRQVTRKD